MIVRLEIKIHFFSFLSTALLDRFTERLQYELSSHRSDINIISTPNRQFLSYADEYTQIEKCGSVPTRRHRKYQELGCRNPVEGFDDQTYSFTWRRQEPCKSGRQIRSPDSRIPFLALSAVSRRNFTYPAAVICVLGKYASSKFIKPLWLTREEFLGGGASILHRKFI